MKDQPHVQDYLLALLQDLDGIQQNPQFHPEGDALFHSLQVFQIALQESTDPILLAAALFHDVGKSVNSKNHDKTGADMLRGILDDQVIWLIEHHLDLLKHPGKTRQKLKQDKRLHDLEKLRKWDLAGRDPFADTLSTEQALSILLEFTKPETKSLQKP